MRISPRTFARFLNFMEIRSTETYPEQPTTWHSDITERAIDFLFANFNLPDSARILDVGCGQGVALKMFIDRGYMPNGIALNETDVAVCIRNGYDVQEMDQSFLEFEDSSFDLVWARHVIEHSFMPFYTLTEFHRVLTPGGILYLEIPGSETLGHECNPNHYSIFGKRMWKSLLQRSGFVEAGSVDYYGTTVNDKSDEYWGYYCIKP